MTEDEWLSCARPLPMLIWLRGTSLPQEGASTINSSFGILQSGPGDRVTAQQCEHFILRCTQRFFDLPLDEHSRDALDAYRAHVLEGAPREEFFAACSRLQEYRLIGGSTKVSHIVAATWTSDPFGAASASDDVAWAIADEKAKAAVAETCATATEEDWFAWSFGCGPPDSLWQSTRREEWRFQADLLREIVQMRFSS